MLPVTSSASTDTRMNHEPALRPIPVSSESTAPFSRTRTVIEATALLVFIVVAACLI